MSKPDADLERWRIDGERMGWQLPAPAPRWQRVFGIRHVRATILAWQIERHYQRWRALGLSGARSGYDEWVVFAVARGFC